MSQTIVSTIDLENLLSEQTGIGWIAVEETPNLNWCVAKCFEYQLERLEDGRWRFLYMDESSGERNASAY